MMEENSSSWQNLTQDLLQMKALDASQLECLQRILQAYSLRDTAPPYCHGMADVCLLLMEFMDEENTFWMLATLVEKLIPEYYQDTMHGLHVDCMVIRHFIELKDVHLHQHFTQHHISMHLLCTTWLLSLYSSAASGFPKPFSLRVFDMILSGQVRPANILIILTVSLLLHQRDSLLQTQDAAEAVSSAIHFCTRSLHEDRVQQAILEQCRTALRQHTDEEISSLRAQFATLHVKEDEKQPCSTESSSPRIELSCCTSTPPPPKPIQPLSKTPFATSSSPWATPIGHFSLRKNTHSPSFEAAAFNLLPESSTTDDVSWRQYQRAVMHNRRSHRRPDARLVSNIRTLSFDGIPEQHRPWVWPILLDDQLQRMMVFSTSYSQLVEDAHGWDTQSALDIEKDVKRTTFVRDMAAAGVDSKSEAALRRILLAYSEKNKSIGYCQGMNELAGILLHTMSDEETAFWAMAVILEVLIPEYHVNSMIGLHMDCAVILSLLHQQDVELYQHLQNIGISMQVLCTKWLMTCFVTALPARCAFRVLDMLLSCANEGIHASRVLLGTALAILLGLRDEILRRDESGDVLQVISTFLNHLSDDAAVISDLFHTAKQIIDTLTRGKIKTLRKRHRHQVATEFAALEVTRQEQREARRSRSPAPTASTASSTTTDHHRRRKKKFSLPRLGWSSSAATSTAATAIDGGLNRSFSDPSIAGESAAVRVDIRTMGKKLEDVAKMYQDGDIDHEEHREMQQRIVEACYGEPVTPRTAQVRVNAVGMLPTTTTMTAKAGSVYHRFVKKLGKHKVEDTKT